MSCQTNSVDILVDLRLYVCNLKLRLFDPQVWGLGGRGGRGLARLIARQLGSY